MLLSMELNVPFITFFSALMWFPLICFCYFHSPGWLIYCTDFVLFLFILFGISTHRDFFVFQLGKRLLVCLTLECHFYREKGVPWSETFSSLLHICKNIWLPENSYLLISLANGSQNDGIWKPRKASRCVCSPDR